MRTNSNFLRLGMGALAIMVWLILRATSTRADDTTLAVTDSVTVTNVDNVDKAWRTLKKATQSPMPPVEWQTNPPTQEEQIKFFLPLVLKGADLAKDFYTRFPNDTHASDAHKLELQMLTIASQQFGDTNQVARLAALQSARLNDPNASEDEKLEWRMAEIRKLMQGMPGTSDELEKSALALQKDFPQRPEVYEVLMKLLSHSDGATAEALAKVITDSPASDIIKDNAKIQLRLGKLQKLVDGLPGSRDELEKFTQALLQDFTGHQDVYQALFTIVAHGDATTGNAVAKQIADSSAPDGIKENFRLQLRINGLQKLLESLPGSRDELEKSAQALMQDFPGRDEVYQALIMIVSHDDATTAEALAKQIAESPAPDNIKAEVKIQLRIGGLRKLIAGLPETRDDLEKAARDFKSDFPKHPEVFYEVMVMVLQNSTGEKLQALSKELTEDPTPDQIKEMVRGKLKQMEALGKPLDMQFTAFDGRAVDLGKMQGKVVLVDFWATWCGPCMGEVPNVKAAYEKLRGKGFEIVGISFDEDKDALTKTLKEKEMTWPQYFDGQGWKNKYGQQFGINSIPTMWLVDKKGNLRDMNARGDLEEKVTKLLAE